MSTNETDISPDSGIDIKMFKVLAQKQLQLQLLASGIAQLQLATLLDTLQLQLHRFAINCNPCSQVLSL